MPGHHQRILVRTCNMADLLVIHILVILQAKDLPFQLRQLTDSLGNKYLGVLPLIDFFRGNRSLRQFFRNQDNPLSLKESVDFVSRNLVDPGSESFFTSYLP